MKKLILTLLIVSASFAGERQCASSIKNHTKYSSRVLSAFDAGVKPSQVNVTLAIDYGIDTISDCKEFLDIKTIQSIKDGVHTLIIIKNNNYNN